MKILQTINNCSGCPYKAVYRKSNMYYFRCDHIRYKGNNDFKPFNNAFLEGCPLKDVGVKVGIAVILLTEDKKILIGKRLNTDSGEGLWGLPGGRMDLWEDPKETAVRETQEETGVTINKDNLDFVFFTNDIFKDTEEHWITLYYLTRTWEGDPKLMEPDKCSEWKWINIHNLSKESIFCGWEEPLKDMLKGE